jgi:hypothetical protein
MLNNESKNTRMHKMNAFYVGTNEKLYIIFEKKSIMENQMQTQAHRWRA